MTNHVLAQNHNRKENRSLNRNDFTVHNRFDLKKKESESKIKIRGTTNSYLSLMCDV